MKILFVTFYFPPYNIISAVRTGKTAKILHQLGYYIKVIAGKPKHLDTSLPIEIPHNDLILTDYFSFEDLFINFRSIIKNFLCRIKSSRSSEVYNIQPIHKKIIYNFFSKIYDIYNYVIHTPDKEIFWYFPAVSKAKELLQHWKPDIIFASARPYTSLLVGYRLSKIKNIPLVIELRDLWMDNHYEKFNYISKILEKKF